MRDRFEELKENLRTRFAATDLGWIPLHAPTTFPRYTDWLARGHAGEMTYLHTHADAKSNPRALLPEARSILLVTCAYLPHPRPQEIFPGTRVAAYARGEDYHVWLRRLVEEIAEYLRTEFPGARFVGGTDVLPLLERDFGAQAGLGWIGKNTCLIHPAKGSFHFIAELLTDIEVPRALTTVAGPGAGPGTQARREFAPLPDFCGTCTKCLDACPTGALESPRVLNATKCISYWTIEAKSAPPTELRPRLLDLFFGCDICQSVCPWNKKVLGVAEDGPAPRALPAPTRAALVASLRWILGSSNRMISARVRGTPLERARPFGLRRNALIVAANAGLGELATDVARWHNDERLGELARWALDRLPR